VRDPFCIYNVHGSVYNSGNGIAKDVIVNIDFIDTQDNQIRLSKTVILGDIGPGVSKDFKNIPLEGKCGSNYSVNMTIAKILITTHKESIEGE
jgi:hypothetical protein